MNSEQFQKPEESPQHDVDAALKALQVRLDSSATDEALKKERAHQASEAAAEGERECRKKVAEELLQVLATVAANRKAEGLSAQLEFERKTPQMLQAARSEERKILERQRDEMEKMQSSLPSRVVPTMTLVAGAVTLVTSTQLLGNPDWLFLLLPSLRLIGILLALGVVASEIVALAMALWLLMPEAPTYVGPSKSDFAEGMLNDIGKDQDRRCELGDAAVEERISIILTKQVLEMSEKLRKQKVKFIYSSLNVLLAIVLSFGLFGIQVYSKSLVATRSQVDSGHNTSTERSHVLKDKQVINRVPFSEIKEKSQ